MGKNNSLRNLTPERKNYKLYKAKKQWFTACATFLVAFGAMAVTNNVQASKEPVASGATTTATVAGSSSAASSAASNTVTADSSATSSTATSAPSAANNSTASSTASSSSVATSSAASSLNESTANGNAAATSVAHSSATSTSSAATTTSTTSANSQSATSSESSAANSTESAASHASSVASNETTEVNLHKLTSSAGSSAATSSEINGELSRSASVRSADQITVTINYVDAATHSTVSSAAVTADSAGHYSYSAADPANYILENRATTTYSGTVTADTTITIQVLKTEQRTYNVIEVEPDGTQKTLMTMTTTIVQRPNGTWGSFDLNEDGTSTRSDYTKQNPFIQITYPSGTNYVSTNPGDPSWNIIHPDTFSGKTAVVTPANSATYTEGIGFEQDTSNGIFFDLFSGDDSYASILPSSNFVITYQPTTAGTVTYTFVDDDEGGAQVGTPVTVSGTVGQTVNTGLTVPTNYALASGQTRPETVTIPTGTTNTTIHLVHAHQNVIQDDIRTLTVHYVDATTGQPMSAVTGLQDAQIEVYYHRTASKDLVTGEVTPTGTWYWDDTGGDTHTGYTVISGNWGRKTNNGGVAGNQGQFTTAPLDGSPYPDGLSHNDSTILAVQVPNVRGYSAVTHGDWQQRVSWPTIGADEYTWPGWQVSPTEGNQTYTNAATAYEAQPDHTIYFVKDQDGTQTVTEHYKEWQNGSAASGSVAPDATINVHYENPVNPSSAGNAFGDPTSSAASVFQTHGSTNPSDWTINYGNHWRWATDEGNSATPGFSTSNASQWSNIGTAGNPTSGSYTANVPARSGETAVTTKVDGSSTVDFDNPGSAVPAFSGSGNTWTTPAKNSTTYYVSNNDLNHTATRTIVIHDPVSGDRTVTQTVTFNRLARVTNDDSGVVFGTLHNNGGSFVTGNNLWNSATSQDGTTNYNQSGDEPGNPTGKWAAYTVPTVTGYTALINGTAGTSVDANNDVTVDTPNSSVTVTYVHNVANITINHAEVHQTFNNRAARIPTNITHPVTADSRITLPAGTDSASLLNDSHFSWQQVNDDGTITNLSGAPTDAGHYRIILNDTGVQQFRNLSSDFTWNYDPSTSYVSYDIDPVNITITQSGSDSKNYDSQPAPRINATTLTNPANMSFSGEVSGYSFVTNTLNSSDFTWYKVNADGTQTEMGNLAGTTGVPTDAGSYLLKLNSTGLQALQNANPNYHITSVSGGYSYTIDQANATVALNDMSNTQSVAWNGGTITINPANFVPSITTDNSNQATIAMPSTITLDPSDYTITPSNPTEPATYQVMLTPSGLQKIENAVNGHANYTWTTTGHGTLVVTRANVTVTLSGNGTTTYTGSVVTIPVRASDGGHYTVTLSNGQTYTLQPGDLEFASTGNTNVGHYTVRLSRQGMNNIQQLEGNHYTYTYDITNTAPLTITPAAATATLHGAGSQTYNGSPATLNGTYTVHLDNRMTYTLRNGDYSFADASGNIISAPTNAGHYRVVLTDQGKNAIENLTNAHNYTWSFGSDAIFDITAQDVTIEVSGSAWKVWDGTNAKLYSTSTTDHGDMSGITVKWNNSNTSPSGITFNLDPGDFEVVDSAGHQVSAANFRHNGSTDQPYDGRGTYYVILTPEALHDIQEQSSNYRFSTVTSSDLTGISANSQATYRIYVRKAALTLENTQTVTYGDLTPLNPAVYRIVFSNWIPADQHGHVVPADVTPAAGDLNVVVPTGQPTEHGVPVNVGRYSVVLSPSSPMVAYLKAHYPDYDFDEIPDTSTTPGGNSGQAAYHTDAFYDVQARQIGFTINGSQTIRYGEANNIDPTKYSLDFTNVAGRDSGVLRNGLTLPSSDDFEFVTTPGNVGNYQVRLSRRGIAYLQSLGNNFATNYAWGQASDPTADFFVERMPVTATVSGSQTISYGTAPTINPRDYSITITTADGTTLTGYTLQSGDLEFVGGTPTHAGTFTVQLSDQGLTNIENHFGTINYTFSKAGNGDYIISKANATVSLTGHQTKTFDNTPANLDTTGYTLTIRTDNGDILTYRLQSGDLQFVDASGNPLTTVPTDVGTYDVALTSAAISRIEALDGNFGNNFNWTLPTRGGATYQITAAQGTATLSGNVSKTYDGTPIAIDSGSDPITVTVFFPGASSSTYTLQPGDYEFVGPDGTVYDSAHAPVNVGNYTIRLTTQGQHAIASLGNGNADWTDGITGTGS